jgi:predicted nucleic acid-binding protein
VIVVIADTSGLVAALDSAHLEDRASNEAIMAAGLLVMSPLLLAAEMDHVAHREFGREAALSAVDDIRQWMRRGRIAVPEITEEHLGVAQSVRARCRYLDLDLADAVNVALAADYDTDAVLTLDRRDFRAVRPLGRHKAFPLLPDDLPP